MSHGGAGVEPRTLVHAPVRTDLAALLPEKALQADLVSGHWSAISEGQSCDGLGAFNRATNPCTQRARLSGLREQRWQHHAALREKT